MTSLNTLLGLLFCLIILPLLKQWISVHLQGTAFLLTGNVKLARWLFWLVLLPGTFLHEVSHWLAASLLFVRTHRLSLWPELKDNGWMQMGAVHMQGRIDPFRHSVIGLAPLICGSLVILLIGELMLDVNELSRLMLQGRLNPVVESIGEVALLPTTWLGLYLIFSISNSMFPSTSDRQAWLPAILYIILLLVIFVALGYTPTIPDSAQRVTLTLMTSLLSAFTLTILVDLLFISLILLFEILLSWLMGRQVVYNR